MIVSADQSKKKKKESVYSFSLYFPTHEIQLHLLGCLVRSTSACFPHPEINLKIEGEFLRTECKHFTNKLEQTVDTDSFYRVSKSSFNANAMTSRRLHWKTTPEKEMHLKIICDCWVELANR